MRPAVAFAEFCRIRTSTEDFPRLLRCHVSVECAGRPEPYGELSRAHGGDGLRARFERARANAFAGAAERRSTRVRVRGARGAASGYRRGSADWRLFVDNCRDARHTLAACV